MVVDGPHYELNLFLAARPRCDVAAQESRVLWKEFAIWNDVKMSQTPSITPGPASALQRTIQAMAEGARFLFFFALIPLSSSSWEELFPVPAWLLSLAKLHSCMQLF